jgi:acyl-CoA reductase-like NAD-dependent aldehyde dehydrogenase
MRNAGWTPGLRDADVERQETLRFESLEVRVQRLTPAGLDALIDRLLDAREAYLAQLPVERIITLLDRVASRWLDPASAYRREAEELLPAITGYAEPAVRKGLASFLSLPRRENLERLVEQELPDPSVLDGFQPHGRGGGQTRAYGPALAVHVWSGNVPGLPAQSLVNALLVKAACLGKVASEEPLFATLLAESIAEVDERLAECLAVVWWPGGDEELERTAFARAEAVIAYGGERAMAAIRERVPRGTRFVEYGHKLSFGAIGREALTREAVEETADRAAYDVAKYDQQGCLSPHLFYVERGAPIAPREFAEHLGQALARYEAAVPRGRVTLEEAGSAASLRQRYELRQAGGEAVALLHDNGPWAVLYDEDASFQPSCLNRTVFVKPVDDLAGVPELAAPVKRYLQTCGVAANPERRHELAGQLGRLGLDRVCPLGRMADVSPEWHHDGRFNLLDLLRWTDLEPEGSAGRWEFAHPDLGLYGR